MTPYQLYVKKWSGGCGAEECGNPGTWVCLGRGSLPCDVLFVGEAPGESENVLGNVLKGPSGHLFDAMRDRALKGLGLTWSAVNVAGCIPRNPDLGGKADEPSHDQIKACRPRLQGWIDLARPRLVVRMGKVAEKWTEPGYKDSPTYPAGCRLAKVVHPAFILKANVAQQGLERQRWVVVVRTACEAMMESAEENVIPY